MLNFLDLGLKENLQILSIQVVITFKSFNFALCFFFFIPGFPSSQHSFIFKAFVQDKVTREELFFQKGFEVCLLNKVFAVIIRLHIKVQNHLVLEVTENCYHLMTLWAELSQTTLHARRNKDPVFWVLPRDACRVWATLRLQLSPSGITGLKSNSHAAVSLICWSPPNLSQFCCYSHLCGAL